MKRVRLHSYVVRWDHGFAPNPFYGVCTVATCEPDIRKVARVGDYVLGTGSAERDLQGRVVFLMRIEKIIVFDTYWGEPTYARKIPVMNGSLQQRFGDNIYHRENGEWIQADSRHSQTGAKPNKLNLNRDTRKTDRVLVGWNFTYWGGSGPPVPTRLNDFVHSTPAHRNFFSEERIKRFLEWIGKRNENGLVGDPGEWKYEKYWR